MWKKFLVLKTKLIAGILFFILFICVLNLFPFVHCPFHFLGLEEGTEFMLENRRDDYLLYLYNERLNEEEKDKEIIEDDDE